MSNRAAVMTAPQTIQIIERETRPPDAHEAVVHIEAVGVCGSDTTYFTVGRIGEWVVDGPIVLGHEAAGTVVQLGADVRNVTLGDRVAIEPGTPCRVCEQCVAGRYHLCPSLQFLATPPYDGALVEELTIDASNLHRIPDSMSFEEGALVEPLSVGLWACKRAGLVAGDSVLVTGAGPVGLLAASVARALGASDVTVTDVSDFRVETARAYGFTAERAGERASEPTASDFDVLLECSGAPGALAAGLGRLRENGRAAMVGIPKGDVSLPLAMLHSKELSINLVNRYAHTWPSAIALVASGRVDVAPLVTHHFGLDGTADALLLARNVPNSIKAIVHPGKVGTDLTETRPTDAAQPRPRTRK
ncbi:NAD(P)-dependent alcohol dehydrogenase [Rathayibacter soli]|uniref:NAD(P)-dependent alcohol dehydrogenase n=1 Tax=Rathayibacter soli TaxID=3144168 RepID=UPI0027E529BD|nr:NAD(P)-dependent alcohol dehydrogenase [Glaciibacter superstes]